MCASVVLGQRMMERIMLLQPYILENPHLENFLYPDHHHGDEERKWTLNFQSFKFYIYLFGKCMKKRVSPSLYGKGVKHKAQGPDLAQQRVQSGSLDGFG